MKKYIVALVLSALLPQLAQADSPQLHCYGEKTFDLIQERDAWSLKIDDQEIMVREVIAYGGKRIFLSENTRSGYALVSVNIEESFEVGGKTIFSALVDIQLFGFPGVKVSNDENYSCYFR